MKHINKLYQQNNDEHFKQNFMQKFADQSHDNKRYVFDLINI